MPSPSCFNDKFYFNIYIYCLLFYFNECPTDTPLAVGYKSSARPLQARKTVQKTQGAN